MQKSVTPPVALVDALRTQIRETSVRAVARKLGVDQRTIAKLAEGRSVSPSTLRAVGHDPVSRSSAKVREADEFGKAATKHVPPRQTQSAHAWSLEAIRRARDLQLLGSFELPYELAKAMRTNDALFTARSNRIAPQSALAANLVPAPGVRGESVAKRAAGSIVCPRTVLRSINGTLADHGVAFGRVTQIPNDDGTWVDFRVRQWPIRFVEWDATHECFMTRVREGGRVPIVHGDGSWIVFSKSEDEPWHDDACLLPGALVYAAHALGLRDWAKSSVTHGNAKVLGTMADGVPTHDADGNLSPEANEFLNMLVALVSDGEQLAGLRPYGYEAEFVANSSTAWQVFSELISNREKAAQRIYLGTDAALGSVGGAPGVDIATLFGVATTKIQGDLEAIERGLRSGVYEPWTAINYGDSRLAPSLKYQLPDPDSDAKRKSQAEARGNLLDAIERMKKNGFVIDQPTINALAEEYGVAPPQLATAGKTSSFVLAPTDVAKVVRVREAREAQGLAPFGDARDDLTIAQLEAQLTAQPAANVPASQPGPALP